LARWATRRFVKKDTRNFLFRPLSKVEIVVNLSLATLLFLGFHAKDYAPNSITGRLVSSNAGELFFLFCASGVAIILIFAAFFVRRQLAIGRLRRKIAEYSFQPWLVSAIEDNLIGADNAFSVALYNDDITHAGFIIGLLHCTLGIDFTSATKIMMETHRRGKYVLGRMAHDNATHLVEYITQKATEFNFPFQCEVVPFAG